MNQTATLTDRQAVAHRTIAAMPGANRFGGPSTEQLDAIGGLPHADRWPVFCKFGEDVKSRLPADVQTMIQQASSQRT